MKNRTLAKSLALLVSTVFLGGCCTQKTPKNPYIDLGMMPVERIACEDSPNYSQDNIRDYIPLFKIRF
jgi:hypothetical protein